MKFVALLACLLTPVAAPVAMAETPAQVQEAAPLASRLRAVLDDVERSHSDDVHRAAELVLAETGDPGAFYALMEEASKAGSASATVWLVPQELNRLGAAGVEMERAPRASELRARVLAAVEKGYRPAYVLAFHLTELGVGAPEDHAAALRHLVAGSKKGCTQARAYYLVVSGRLQKGGPKEPAVAAELERHNYHLEELVAQSLGDTEAGVYWLRRATEHGSALAPYLLTRSRTAGLTEAESMAQLELAASRYQTDAMALLGDIRLRAQSLNAGMGTKLKEDVDGGEKLLCLAAALGSADAAQSLASAMAQGLLGDVTPTLVCSLYRMAAEQGNPHGQAGYGYCLMGGLGCPADAAHGEKLLRLAVEKGAQWANQALASVYFNGLGVKPDLRRAVNALGEDAAMGSVHAYAIMAGITALGNEGTAPDAMRARIYLDMAEEDGDEEARAIYDAILSAGGWKFLPALW